MIGPVFFMELQHGSRRDGLRRLIRIYSGWLILQCFVVFLQYWTSSDSQRRHVGEGPLSHFAESTSRLANSYPEIVVEQHFLLLLLATPPFVAGAITDEKTRGTLQFLLAADVSSWDIVMGKLLGRLTQVAILSLAGLPFLCFFGGLGGLEGRMIAGIAGVTAGPLFVLGAASILASVWSTETREAVLRVYASLVLGVCLIGGLQVCERMPAAGGALAPVNAVLRYLNPIYVLAPSWEHRDRGELAWRLLTSVLAWGGLGAMCVGVAAWRLKPAYSRQLEGQGRARQARPRVGRRRPVGDDPIAWREREVEGLAIVPALRRVPPWVSFFSVALVSVGLFLALGRGGILFAFLAPFVIISLVGIRTSTAVCGERERQTWDLLLLIPEDTGNLLKSKLHGVLQATYPYLIAYLLSTIFLFVLGFEGMGLAFSAWLLLGFSWNAMYYMGAVGMMWSVRARSSWKSLLATMVHAYAGILVVYFAASVFSAGAAGILLAMYRSVVPPGPVVTLMAALVTLGVILMLQMALRSWTVWSLSQAEKSIDQTERVCPQGVTGVGPSGSPSSPTSPPAALPKAAARQIGAGMELEYSSSNEDILDALVFNAEHTALFWVLYYAGYRFHAIAGIVVAVPVALVLTVVALATPALPSWMAVLGWLPGAVLAISLNKEIRRHWSGNWRATLRAIVMHERKNRKTDEVAVQYSTLQVSFDAEGFTEIEIKHPLNASRGTARTVETRVPWKSVTKIEAQDNYIVIRVGGQGALIVPRRIFPDASSCQTFMETLRILYAPFGIRT